MICKYGTEIKSSGVFGSLKCKGKRDEVRKLVSMTLHPMNLRNQMRLPDPARMKRHKSTDSRKQETIMEPRLWESHQHVRVTERHKVSVLAQLSPGVWETAVQPEQSQQCSWKSVDQQS